MDSTTSMLLFTEDVPEGEGGETEFLESAGGKSSRAAFVQHDPAYELDSREAALRGGRPIFSTHFASGTSASGRCDDVAAFTLHADDATANATEPTAANGTAHQRALQSDDDGDDTDS